MDDFYEEVAWLIVQSIQSDPEAGPMWEALDRYTKVDLEKAFARIVAQEFQYAKVTVR